MAQYLVLIYEAEARWEELDEAGQAPYLGQHVAFGEKNGASIRGGGWLEATTSATSIRHDASGGTVVTDGPFAEAKEALGGYYLIEAADLDEALEIAKQVPASFGGVEVRPLRPMG